MDEQSSSSVHPWRDDTVQREVTGNNMHEINNLKLCFFPQEAAAKSTEESAAADDPKDGKSHPFFWACST